MAPTGLSTCGVLTLALVFFGSATVLESDSKEGVLLQMRLCTGPSFWQCYCVADEYALTVGGDVLLSCFG